MESAQRTQPGQPAIQVRSDFRTTAAWLPAVVTDTSGQALVPVRFSDSLTTWRATARAFSDRDLFGQGTTTVLTNQPLMVRLQSPRFLQVGDTTTVSAIVNNNSDGKARVRVNLGVKGVRLSSPALRILTVPSQGESRVDWTLDVRVPGSVRLEVRARSSHASDAMRRELTAHAHGIEKLVATAGKTNRERTALTVTLPPHQETDRQMIVQVTPSLAVTMLDALPYLIDYPYGCTEQTMSRFLPAAITARTLAGLGLSPEAIAGGDFFIREIKAAAVENEAASQPADPSVGQSRYTRRSRWVHRELRDRKVALFVDKLPQGLWEMRYQLRAEAPGTFHALPLLGHAMYVPEIRCNSDEVRIQILDR